MAILRGTDLMRDSPRDVGGKIRASTAWPSGPESGPRKLHSATSLRVTPHKGGRSGGFGWKSVNAFVRGLERKEAESKNSMWIIDKTKRERVPNARAHRAKLGGGVPRDGSN
jgi:hypothetical protein